jgi:hypothetical protein
MLGGGGGGGCRTEGTLLTVLSRSERLVGYTTSSQHLGHQLTWLCGSMGKGCTLLHANTQSCDGSGVPLGCTSASFHLIHVNIHMLAPIHDKPYDAELVLEQPRSLVAMTNFEEILFVADSSSLLRFASAQTRMFVCVVRSIPLAGFTMIRNSGRFSGVMAPPLTLGSLA